MKTKRIFAFLICLCLLLSGCRNATASKHWQPSKASADIEPYARQAIKIIDQYLSFEIDRESAEESFDEVQLRMNTSDCEESPVEWNVHFAIMDLYLDAEDLTDTDFRKYRDILAFQIGEQVSGKAYEVDSLDISADDATIAKSLRISDIPVLDFSLSKLDSGYGVSIYFDAMNGVHPDDLDGYIEGIIANAEQEDIALHDIWISYFCYDQQVFSLAIWLQPVDDNKQVTLIGTEGDEYTTLGEYDSLDKIPDALNAAETYLGEYAP